MNKIVHILLFTLIFSFGSLKGQNSSKAYKLDTLSIQKNVEVIGLPVVFYTPETKFGFGGGAQLFFHRQLNIFNSRLSSLLITAIYTSEKQLILDARPQFYFYEGKVYLDGLFKYKVYPNSFWGIGINAPEENLERYNMRSFEITAALLYRLPPSLNFGFEYQYKKHTMLEVEESGMLATNEINGSDGALTSGISFVFNFDNRDNVFSTVRGAYAQLFAGFSNRVFGATHSYSKYRLDVRKYFVLARINTLALQVYLEDTYGDVPFQSMGWLGGGEKMRGFFRGRYMDKHMYTVQAEYRIRFHPRWIVSAFGAIGSVGGVPSDLFIKTYSSYGGGIRFKPLKSNPTFLRLDFGINNHGGTGIYFGVNEAF